MELLFPKTSRHGCILSTRTGLGRLFVGSFPTSSDVIVTSPFKEHPGITSLAYELLSAAGFDVYPDQGIIEFHEYTPEKRYSPLAIHCDDYGATPYRVHTCIFYLQKDPGLAGGNLDVWDEPPGWFSCCFPAEPAHEIAIKPGMVLLMSGDVYHRPQDVDGAGTRRSVVVQLRARPSPAR